jgi:hypothetical protein
MKPLATPVLGGMVSSLLHVLIVTPVIFYWLREREINKQLKLKEDTGTVEPMEVDADFARETELAKMREPEKWKQNGD